jgi:Protein of unknown function (DUF1326)
MISIPSWRVIGDWFDNCSCAVACPCTFGQPPDNNFCESVLFWHIERGHYGGVSLDGLSFVRVSRWEGDLWAGKAAQRVYSLMIERMSGRPKRFRSFSGDVREDSPPNSPHYSREVEKFAARSELKSHSRSRPTARTGEPRLRER